MMRSSIVDETAKEHQKHNRAGLLISSNRLFLCSQMMRSSIAEDETAKEH